MRKNCSSDSEKLLKYEAEGQEFAKFWRSLEQFIHTVKGQNNVGNKIANFFICYFLRKNWIGYTLPDVVKSV